MLIREMRSDNVLGVLFPTIRYRVLSATLKAPDKWWYLSELAHHLGITPSSLERELPSLANAGILLAPRQQRRSYYKAHQNSPIYLDLRRIFEKANRIVNARSHSVATRYDRLELYDQAWAMPMHQLAKLYGVSDVAVAKASRKLRVPLPGRGYWAKKAAAKPVPPRPPLPPL